MLRYTLTRTVQALIVIAVMSFMLFVIIGLMPGDPLENMFEGNPSLTPELIRGRLLPPHPILRLGNCARSPLRL